MYVKILNKKIQAKSKATDCRAFLESQLSDPMVGPGGSLVGPPLPKRQESPLRGDAAQATEDFPEQVAKPPLN